MFLNNWLRKVVGQERARAEQAEAKLADWRAYSELQEEQFGRIVGMALAQGWRGDQDLHDRAKPLRERLKLGEFADPPKSYGAAQGKVQP
jgi:hypothetical protein